MDDVVTWGGNSGFETQPLPFVISGLVAFAFLTVPFVLLHFWWTKQLRKAQTRFSGQCLRGFRALTWVAWINICLLPAIMMFYPVWTLRLLGIFVMGGYFLFFLYHNWGGMMQVVDPFIVKEMEKVVQEEIKPAVEALPKDNSDDVVAWAKGATEKLEGLIARLRGKDDAS